jgi:hypothetical protein
LCRVCAIYIRRDVTKRRVCLPAVNATLSLDGGGITFRLMKDWLNVLRSADDNKEYGLRDCGECSVAAAFHNDF